MADSPSSPVETSAFSRASSASSLPTPSPSCRMKAVRSKTERSTPQSSSPQFSAVSSGIGAPLSVS